MNTNPRYRWCGKLGSWSFGFLLRSIGPIVALGVGLSPTLAVAGDDLNSRYRNSFLEDQTHIQLGTRSGPATGGLGKTSPGRRPTDQSLMPSLGLKSEERVGGQGRDR
jgi:hypothetical protein